MKICKILKTTLTAPFSASATTLTVAKFVDLDGTEVAMSDFGTFGVVVIKQGTTVEIVKFSSLAQSATDATCVLTVATSGRSIAGTSPYAGAATGLDFNSGSEVIVTNDPLTLSRFGNLDVAATWDAIQTFSVLPRTIAGNPVDDNDLVRKSYVDSSVGGGTGVPNRVVIAGNGGETVAAGNLLYLDVADGEWKKADADTAAFVENVNLGIAQGAGTDGVAITNGVLIYGLDSNQTGLTTNTKYYASNTAGSISTSAGTKEVTVGISRSTTSIFFNPRFDQQLTEDQQDALVGTSGTPSATNKVVTDADPRVARAIQTSTPAGAATDTLDLSTGSVKHITMPAGNITIALSNGTIGQCFIIRILQDSVGSRTVTWFTTIRWAGGTAPTLTTTANKADTFGFEITGANTYDGFIVGNNI
jgi:hypothetical protein